MPCQFCNFDCFVSIPKDTPAEIAAQIRDQKFFYSTDGMLATCPDGQKEDKASLWGTNYSEIMAAICAQEEHAMIDRLLDRKAHMTGLEMQCIARGITNHIFRIGDESEFRGEIGKVYRIEFKGGKFGDETAQGGLDRYAFQRAVLLALEDYENERYADEADKINDLVVEIDDD